MRGHLGGIARRKEAVTMKMILKFKSDAEIRRIGNGLLNRSLPKQEWTHVAHCAATIYLQLERPELDLPKELPGIIKAYNIATGVVNSEYSGYHETITQFYLIVIDSFLGELDQKRSLVDVVNKFIQSEFGQRDFPLTYYSKERLFSAEARRTFFSPDLMPMEILACRALISLGDA